MQSARVSKSHPVDPPFSVHVLNYRFVPVWIRTFHSTRPWITVLTTGTHQGKALNTSTVEEEMVHFFMV